MTGSFLEEPRRLRFLRHDSSPADCGSRLACGRLIGRAAGEIVLQLYFDLLHCFP
jgi:hypothetical protein